ncbi:MAG: DUF4330 family protein [Clostridia bacterium]|nr:DUF4330 family protein [Clostridia bacterium]MBR6650305.1 DUF4330 family protein [Clostridia bacterium]
METYSKKRFAAIDVFIILLLCCATFAVGFKVFAGNAGLFAGAEENYYISYVIESADSEVGKLITSGSIFYFENEKLFGSVAGDVITTPARIYNESAGGEYVLSYSSGAQVDITGTFYVSGKMTEKGLVCGGEYISPGMSIKIYGNGASPNILITDISKVSQ